MEPFTAAAQLGQSKLESFILNNPKFNETLNYVFSSVDFDSSGRIAMDEAALSIAWLFDSIQDALNDYGVKVKKPTAQQLKTFFQDSDKNLDGKMTREEFKAFYVGVLKYAVAECTTQVAHKYGAGMAAGVVGLFVAKRLIRSIPVVGMFASPVLALVPTLLLGPLLGAAAVYTYDKRDLFALQKKFFPKYQSQFTAG